ncbi:MAG: DUF4105 domain-containing protein [Bacteroidaceae bacterium]|nr:DUF4105 domain-containing protein [Bacteroidaceae bacterium]
MTVDSLRADTSFVVSLLTCSPGQEVYELYGHTAIRVLNNVLGIDEVFNYGVFSFSQPHFVLRFVLGKCDYMVAAAPLAYFLQEYASRGSSVTEQVLNLRPTESRELSLRLFEAIQPGNSEYRYNIFRNNCTTKARDIIEGCIRGEVVYPARPRRNSFRTILHQYTQGHAWAREGNDLLLGASVDTAICERDEMFSPIYMMHYADSAFIDAGRTNLRPLVSERRELLPENPERQASTYAQLPSVPFSPATFGWVLLAIGLLIAFWEWRRGRICWPVDAVLMTLQGLAGLLLTFMAVASEHPGVASNWQVWVLNPLPLLFVLFVVKADIRRQSHVYHSFAAIWLAAFMVLFFVVPQHFSKIILPVALLLLSRAIVHLIVYKKS